MGVNEVNHQRAVFLDRDGVINRSVVREGRPYPPASLEELELNPGVPEGLKRLKEAGFDLIVATNQPDVARGTKRKEDVELIHEALQAQLPLDEIRVCYHDDDDDPTQCRKPKPGMLLAAAETRKINLKNSFMIGDRWRDIEAGRRAGCTTIFIDYHYAEKNRSQPDVTVASVAEAIDWILDREE